MKNNCLCIFLFLFSGCQKEDSTIYLAYLKNTTSHQIKIQPYTAGYIVQQNIINLPPGEKFEFAYGHARGLQNDGGFSSK